MTYPKLCRDCKFSTPEMGDRGTLCCTNPQVNGQDPWALASSKQYSAGTKCADQRAKGWWFGVCGMRGAKWEQKP